MQEVSEVATHIANESNSDVFFYSGEIQHGSDLGVIQTIYKNCKRTCVTLILVTNGGDPHAAYKLSRYLQDHYEKFTVIISGVCKSAGTLVAVGAHELVFAPYGELGPMDVQSYKIDNLSERQSGLTITQSLEHLTRSAITMHGHVFSAIISATGAIVSFKTAAQASSELITGLYEPMFSQIDPMEVGDKARSMRIASDYGKRLDARSRNLKAAALSNLTQTYPSHSFVIDMQEASSLFENVRPWSNEEQQLVELLGTKARFEHQNENREPEFTCLSKPPDEGEDNEAQAVGTGSAEGDKQDSPEAVGASDSPNRDGGGDGIRAANLTSI